MSEYSIPEKSNANQDTGTDYMEESRAEILARWDKENYCSECFFSLYDINFSPGWVSSRAEILTPLVHCRDEILPCNEPLTQK